MAFTAITATGGGAAGTSPPAPVFRNKPRDDFFCLSFGTGSGSPTAGAQVVVTFGSPYNGLQESLPAAFITARNAAAAALGPWYVTMDVAGTLNTNGTASLCCSVAPAVSQANTVYELAVKIEI